MARRAFATAVLLGAAGALSWSGVLPFGLEAQGAPAPVTPVLGGAPEATPVLEERRPTAAAPALNAERFFELVNGFEQPGIYTTAAQGGTQMLIVTIRASVPGSGTATTPTTPSDTGTSIETLTLHPSYYQPENLDNYSDYGFGTFQYDPYGSQLFSNLPPGPLDGDPQIVIEGLGFNDYATQFIDTRCTWSDCSVYYDNAFVDPSASSYQQENATTWNGGWPLYYDSTGGWNAYRQDYSGLFSSCDGQAGGAICSDVFWGPVLQEYGSILDELCSGGATANSSGCNAAFNYFESVAQSGDACSGEPAVCGSGLIVPGSCSAANAPPECGLGQPVFTYPCTDAGCTTSTHTVVSTSGCTLDDRSPSCHTEQVALSNFLALNQACQGEGAPEELCSAVRLPQCTGDGCESWSYAYAPTIPDTGYDCGANPSYWGCSMGDEYENRTAFASSYNPYDSNLTTYSSYGVTYRGYTYDAYFTEPGDGSFWYAIPTPKIVVTPFIEGNYTFDIEAAQVLSTELAESVDVSCSDCDFYTFDLTEVPSCTGADAPSSCGYAAGVAQSALEVYSECTGDPSAGICPTFISSIDLVPGNQFVRLTTPVEAGDPFTYTLRIATGTEPLETCSPDWSQPGCVPGLNFHWSWYRYQASCAADPTAVCLEGAMVSTDQLDELRSTVTEYGSYLPGTPASGISNETMLTTTAPPSIPTGATIIGEDDLSITYVTPEGSEIIIGKGDTEVVDITNEPGAIVTDAEGLTALGTEGGPTMGALITSTGASTGPGAFTMQIVNLGKARVVDGQGLVFEPVPAEQADAIRNAFASVVLNANEVTSASPTGYCLEEQKSVPTSGELFSLANRGKQQQFAAARTILDAAPGVRAAGVLTPDSADADAYYHSIVQWSVWVSQENLDKDGFAQRFLERTRQNFINSGQQWDESYEDLVLGLVDNRHGNISAILTAAGLPVPGAADELAARERVGTALQLALAGIAALAAVLIGRRQH